MSSGEGRLGLTERTERGIAEVLAGRNRSWKSKLLFAGPAVVASIAYIDPGNFATNIQAGAGYGYSLLWVVLVANVIAMLFQALSAKLGIVTSRNLAELSREQFPAPVVYGMWVISEIAAMATDLGEFLGGAIGFSLLFHLSLFTGMIVTGVVTYLILIGEKRGFRPLELIIGGLVAAVALCYVVELLMVHIDWPATLFGTFVPQLHGSDALAVAVAILGATVMPHAIYLHSGLTQSRTLVHDDAERRRLIRFSHAEVLVALTVAGLVNMAMVIMASCVFHAGHPDVAEIETAYHSLAPLLGSAAAAVFLIALLASGVSSSVVATMAGQMIMQGFTEWRIPVGIRRLITMVPAFVVIMFGVSATHALIYSQVVLSFAVPVPMISLVVLTTRRDVMGVFVNRKRVTCAAIVGTSIIVVLNAVLVLQTLGVAMPVF